MLCACGAKRNCAVIGVLFALGAVVAGCATTQGGPERLYPVADEAARARAVLDGPDGISGLTPQYYAAASDLERMYYRNEIVARRMYVIDVEYTAYEAALTSERQEFGFASAIAGQGLTTAGALFTPAATVRVLSGVASGVSATKGIYDTELVIAKTIQIAEGQMRAQRDTVAARIIQRRGESAVTYPLSVALSDVEDYYRAGTLNSGLIEAATQSGNAATDAAETKALVVSYGSNLSTQALAACLKKPGARDRLASLFTPPSHIAVGRLLVDVTVTGERDRASLLMKANAAGICP